MMTARRALALLLLVGGVSAHSAPERAAPPDFRNDILPIFTRLGCNAGTCHGAALGQDGFKLSLLGYDADADFRAITRQFRGRRINLADPDASLILQKPTNTIPHSGGKRFARSSDHYRLIRDWLAAGAPERAERAARLERVEVDPPASLKERVALTVTAWYSDGSKRNVTSLALFDAIDEAVADVSENGRVRILRSGETAVMVRYGGHVKIARVGLPHTDTGWKEASVNFIDAHVVARLNRLGLKPGARADDDRFRRRLWLDTVGRLPEEGDPFESPAFETYWTAWLLRQFGAPIPWGAPLDEAVRDVLTARGRTRYAAFYGNTRDPRLIAEKVSQRFLGRRIQCAQCHNHPFEAFTQDDYYAFTAFFARIVNRNGEIVLRPRGEAIHPRRRKEVAPAFPGGVAVAVPDDRRVPLADWIVRHPDFSRSIVNRLWAHFFGRGIVDPPDDIRVSNPPENPELLDAMAKDFVEHGHDLTRTIRLIVASNAYRRNGESRVPPGPVLVTMLQQATGGTLKNTRVFESQTLAQVLRLLNGAAIHEAVSEAEIPERNVVEALFRRALCRPPTPAERERYAGAETSREVAEDLLWALINSKEFYFIH